MNAFAPEFEHLVAVFAAEIDLGGTLRDSNAGCRRLLYEAGLCSDPEAVADGTAIDTFFIQPAFSALSAPWRGAPDEPCHTGLLTVGDRAGRTRTLRGRVWRTRDSLRVLAEHDIAELERISDSFLELGREALETQSALGRTNLALRQREARMAESALTDVLTGVGNRRRLDEALAAEISRARRSGEALSTFIADLDYFKSVNDRFGHAAGDQVLVRFAALARAHIRTTDVLARFGGEEFVVLLPNTDAHSAAATAERIRAALAAETIAPLPGPISASFGVAELGPDEDAAGFLERADQALYAAKNAGRNQVVVAPADACSETIDGA